MKYFSKRISSVALAVSLAVGGSSVARAEGEGSKLGPVKLEPAYLANVLIGMNNNQRFFNSKDLKNLACVSKKSTTAMDIVRIFDFTHMEDITNPIVMEQRMRDVFKFYPNLETIACSHEQFELIVKSESIMNFLREIMQKRGKPINFDIRYSVRSAFVLNGYDTTETELCTSMMLVKDFLEKLKGFKVTCHEYIEIDWLQGVMYGTSESLNRVIGDIKNHGGKVMGCCYLYNTNLNGKLDRYSVKGLGDIEVSVPGIKLFSDIDARCSTPMLPEKSEHSRYLSLTLDEDSRMITIKPTAYNRRMNTSCISAKHVHDFTE